MKKSEATTLFPKTLNDTSDYNFKPPQFSLNINSFSFSNPVISSNNAFSSTEANISSTNISDSLSSSESLILTKSATIQECAPSSPQNQDLRNGSDFSNANNTVGFWPSTSTQSCSRSIGLFIPCDNSSNTNLSISKAPTDNVDSDECIANKSTNLGCTLNSSCLNDDISHENAATSTITGNFILSNKSSIGASCLTNACTDVNQSSEAHSHSKNDGPPNIFGSSFGYGSTFADLSTSSNEGGDCPLIEHNCSEVPLSPFSEKSGTSNSDSLSESTGSFFSCNSARGSSSSKSTTSKENFKIPQGDPIFLNEDSKSTISSGNSTDTNSISCNKDIIGVSEKCGFSLNHVKLSVDKAVNLNSVFVFGGKPTQSPNIFQPSLADSKWTWRAAPGVKTHSFSGTSYARKSIKPKLCLPPHNKLSDESGICHYKSPTNIFDHTESGQTTKYYPTYGEEIFSHPKELSSKIISTKLHNITLQKEYLKISQEELRFLHYRQFRKSDASYTAIKFSVNKSTQTDNSKTEVLRDVWQIIECPVCLDILLPPVYQCDLGHNICNTCWSKLKFCPLCKNRKSRSRNFLAEELLDKISLPCKFRTYGCEELLTKSQKLLHEKNCYYQTYLCPMKNCQEEHNFQMMVQHLKSTHSTHFSESWRPLPSCKFRQVIYKTTLEPVVHIFNIDEWGIFVLSFEKCNINGSLYLRVIQANQSVINFSYRIKLTDDKDTRGFGYKGDVHCFTFDQKDIIALEECLIVPDRTLKNLLAKPVRIKISIMQKGNPFL